MKKIKTLLKAPVLTQSGYGVHSRQIFKALIENPQFDVFVESLTWGNTPFLTRDTEEKKVILQHVQKRAVAKQQNDDQFDLFIHVTIPNEFEKLGKFNIGVTAGIETDRVSHVWVQKCQEMDMIVVPSEHSRKVLCDTEIEWENPRTKERGSFKLTKPVIVCNEGVDTRIFHKWLEGEQTPLLPQVDFKPDFNFLHVGQWGRGGFGEDRKNVALLVKYFIETFKGRDDVGLVLKLNMARNSTIDYDHTLNRLREIKQNWKPEEVPPIYLLHGNLSDGEMSALYNHPKIKAFISLTHGEGYGLPLIEAAACGLPILATNWSGHLDFLNKGKFSAIKYDMKVIPDVAVWGDILIKGSRWAEVQEEDVKHRMKKIVSSYSIPKEWAKDLAEKIKEEFDLSVVCQNFVDTIKIGMKQDSVASKVNPVEHLASFVDTPDNYNVLYTMPMSAGDVFVSTAVLDGLVKTLTSDAKIYFATQPQYMDILKNNPHIHKVIPWNETMMNVELLEEVFDIAFLPNITTQYTFSNYVRRGQGRLLAEEFANHCICELGEYFIDKEPITSHVLPQKYMTIHPGSGEGQWEARKYLEWQEIVDNLKNLYPELSIVHVGGVDEPKLEGAVDLRGTTNVNQLAYVIDGSELHLSIDTFTMHLAAAFDTPVVALFGSSHAKSSGPWYKNREKAKIILLEAEQKLGCSKACYKYQCKKNRKMPCINEIDPMQVFKACCAFLGKGFGNTHEKFEDYKYERVYGKISGYTTAYNLKGYPFVESIKSMLGFCDEVVVVDGCSDDGTYETLEELAKEDERVQLYQNPWDFDEPGIDGMQKTFARALCEHEFLWQQDCDEVVHEDDYEKIKMITKRFPDADILHLPVIELWSDQNEVTGRRHCWKWRMSRNKPEIIHGINKGARLTDEKTGKVYAKQGMSDGCEYVNCMTNEMLPHVGFYNQQIELARVHMPDKYAEGINEVFDNIPGVFHYSWFNLEAKIRQLKNGGVWDKLWSLLYQTKSQKRFSDVETEEDVKELSEHLHKQGGEDSDQVKYKFKLNKSHPAIMKKWIEKNKRK